MQNNVTTELMMWIDSDPFVFILVQIDYFCIEVERPFVKFVCVWPKKQSQFRMGKLIQPNNIINEYTLIQMHSFY